MNAIRDAALFRAIGAPVRAVSLDADGELKRAAASYEAVNAEIRRLEAMPEQPDDDLYEPLDQERFAAMDKASELQAVSLAGLVAKASILLGDIDLVGDFDEDGSQRERLAIALARNVLLFGGVKVPPSTKRGVLALSEVIAGPSPDAVLIAACDRLVAVEAQLTAASDQVVTFDDEGNMSQPAKGLCDQVDDAVDEVFDEGLPRTLAGARALARASNAIGLGYVSQERNLDTDPVILASRVVEFLSGREGSI